MEPKERIVKINNLDYLVVPFKYVTGFIDEKELFFLLEGVGKVRNYKVGEVYIIIPSWVEIQDLYQSSSEKNIMTKKYEVNNSWLRINKIKKLCSKISDAEGRVYLIDEYFALNVHATLGTFIVSKVDKVISDHYMGSGLSKEEEKEMAEECYKYYSAVYKERAGKSVTIPPCPGPVLLMSVCKTYNCTPDIARKISKRDIDMLMIAREQENLCQDSNIIGLTKSPFFKR